MKSLIEYAAVAVLSLGLAGCYTAEESIIGQGVTPFETITFRADGDDTSHVLTRAGDGYVTEADGTTLTMRFAEIDTNLYVAEATAGEGDEMMRLYGGVRVFPETGRAEAFRVIADDEADIRPGLRPCGDDAVCIDDPGAYADLIRADIAAGAEPAASYDITLD